MKRSSGVRRAEVAEIRHADDSKSSARLESKRRYHSVLFCLVCLAMAGSAQARPESATDAAAAPRFSVLAQPISVPAGARSVSLRVAANGTAVLHANGRSFRLGTRVRYVVIP